MNENPDPTPSAVTAEARAIIRKLQQHNPSVWGLIGTFEEENIERIIQAAIDSTRSADRATIERLTAELEQVKFKLENYRFAVVRDAQIENGPNLWNGQK